MLVTALTAATKYLTSLRKISCFYDNDEKGIAGRRMRQLVTLRPQEAESDESWLVLIGHLLLLIGVSSLWGWMVPLIWRVDLPSSVKAIWK